MRVVPRIIITIRPGMQKCIPGLFCANQQSQRGAGRSAMGSMEAQSVPECGIGRENKSNDNQKHLQRRNFTTN